LKVDIVTFMPTSPSREERIRSIKDTFHYLMWVAMRHLSQLLQPFGLTFPQYVVLAALAAHQQACTMRDLTSATFEDPPTMTGIVDRLVKMGLVARARSETDRRVVLVQVTRKGADLFSRVDNAITQDTLNGYDRLSDDELETLEQLFQYKLRMHVGQHQVVNDAELDCEIEKLREFFKDPIQYTKVEKTKPGF
jgi:DNA-binding MarR family transcriptional regulator